MNNTFVIGDIHGGLKALKQVLQRAQVQPRDTLIFLGDYVDGWSESPQVLDYLMTLEADYHCVFIRGNHDDLLLNYLKTHSYSPEWYKHGGETTIEAYRQVDDSTRQRHITFLERLENYYLDNWNRLFVHAGFTNLNGIEHEFFKPMFYWDRTLWETALALDNRLSREDPYYPKRLTLYKEVYIGHTPTTRIHELVPVQKVCVWNVDTGAAFKGPLTIMDINSKAFWQSDPLPELYPHEKGRN